MALFGGKKGKVELQAAPAAPARAPQPAARVNGAASKGDAPAAASTNDALLALGQIMSLLMSNATFAKMSLAEVRALVRPAITNGQFVLATAQIKAGAPAAPIGVALWATVSDEIDKRLSDNIVQPLRLAPGEWKSGENAWLMALVGDRRALNPMLARLQRTALQNRSLKARVVGKDGKAAIAAFSVNADAPAR